MTSQNGSPEKATAGATPAADAGPPSRNPRSPLKVCLLAVAALPVVCLVGALTYVLVRVVDTRGSRDLAAAKAEARAAGLPIDYSDPVFRRYETAASLDKNAATIYGDAFDIISGLQTESRDPNLPVVGRGVLPDDGRTALSPEMLSAVRQYVSQRQHALELIHEASGIEPCLFPTHWTGPATDLAHLSRARTAARLVELGVILQAEEGSPHEAVSTVLDGLALSRQAMEEPAMISSLVGLATDSVTLVGAQRLLARTNPTAEDLAVLQEEFETSAEALSLRVGLGGEIAHTGQAFKTVATASASFLQGHGDDASKRGGKMRIGELLFRHDLEGGRAEMIRMYVKLISAAAKPTPEILAEPYEKALDSQLAASRYRFASLARMVLPATCRAMRQCELIRARLRAAAACVAALRFRNDTGTWPASLDALAGEYITAVPLDPFTSKPLIYRVREDGILVYSVGTNGMDDGGKRFLIKPDESDTGTYDDFGFRIWK